MTMSRTLFAAAALLASGLTGLYVQAQAQDAPSVQAPLPAIDALPSDAGRGREIYLRNSCQACHGTVGQGGGPGPILAATEMPYEAFVMQMREPSATMPAYDAKLLSDQDLADIHAYLKSLPGPSETLPRILRN